MRLQYATNKTQCNDQKLHWEVTPCLCDCHFGWPECGDRAKVQRSVGRVKVERVSRHREGMSASERDADGLWP